MLEALVINCCKDVCRIELTAIGNAGELDNCEYQIADEISDYGGYDVVYGIRNFRRVWV